MILSLSVEVLKLIVAAFCAKEQQLSNKYTNSAIACFDIVFKIQVLFLNCKREAERFIIFVYGTTSKKEFLLILQ